MRRLPSAPSADYGEELLELAAQGKVKLPEIPADPNLWRTLKPAKLKTKGIAASDLLRRIMDEERGKF
ncbi:MAG: hypothetical protein MOB07_17200 [Acidobacteria bacterium]|nr:hypothetical protein [Acidobacteriota bacterium]